MSETMADYEDQINASFRSFREGDTVTGEVVSVEEEEVLLDLRSFSQGVIPSGEYSDDPNFHAMDEIRTGEMLTAVVLSPDDGQGRVLLSLREAKREEAWEQVEKALEERTVFTVKVNNSVNAGVVAYCEGLRGFIPASKLALEYVEDVEEYVGKTLSVIVITADREANKLVLSAKDVEKESSGLFASPFCKVFRRWLKDARIRRNINFSSDTSIGTRFKQSSLITALPTFGRGIKQFGGTFAARYGFA